jgi:hypothetical protein
MCVVCVLCVLCVVCVLCVCCVCVVCVFCGRADEAAWQWTFKPNLASTEHGDVPSTADHLKRFEEQKVPLGCGTLCVHAPVRFACACAKVLGACVSAICALVCVCVTASSMLL